MNPRATKQKIAAQEAVINRSILISTAISLALIICYLFFVYSSTATAYAIELQERNNKDLTAEVSELENAIHNVKRELAVQTVSDNLVAIENERYLKTSTDYYSLASLDSSSQ
tara:strand:- start:1274 stop:1612 length:339 start_codon:yes stop_codon:yes gene_type:complete